MDEPLLTITKAPAYATIQDTGRRGFLASGVPRAGAMDLVTLLTLNAMLGNDDRAAGIEWALTGGQLTFSGRATFAFGGADAAVALGEQELEPFRAYHASTGDVLSVNAIRTGRFVYLAFGGGIDCAPVMNSRSTYVPGGFGGLDGRRLKTGDTIEVGKPKGRTRPQVSDPLPDALRPPVTSEHIRYVARHDGDAAIDLTGSFSISTASDRTGYRLAGGPDLIGASITSEPVCPGTIQLPSGGEPIVLMADAPTIGGYRILGGVIWTDIALLSQRLPGETIQLEPVSVQVAQRAMAERFDSIDRVREWALA